MVARAGDPEPSSPSAEGTAKAEGPNDELGDLEMWPEGVAPTIALAKNYGFEHRDGAGDIAVDKDGNYYLMGHATKPNKDGTTYSYRYLAKLNEDGEKVWARTITVHSPMSPPSVAVDGVGNSYITGTIEQQVEGRSFDLPDVFVAKLDTEGNPLWCESFGTPKATDQPHCIAVDSAGNSYVFGMTWGQLGDRRFGREDMFLVSYDTDGQRRWVRQLGGTHTDSPGGMTLDSAGNCYVTGKLHTDRAGGRGLRWDGFVAKYDTDGTQQWLRTLDTEDYDHPLSIQADAKGYFLAGKLGTFSADAKDLREIRWTDAFVSRYDSDGKCLWTTRAKSVRWRLPSYGVASGDDTDGRCILVGDRNEWFRLTGVDDADKETSRVFVGRLGPDGQWQLRWQPVVDGATYVNSLTRCPDGGWVFAGTTEGGRFGDNHGESDAFVAKVKLPAPDDTQEADGK
jgi:hypothetical protein